MRSRTTKSLTTLCLLLAQSQAGAQEIVHLDADHCCAAQAGEIPAEAYVFSPTNAAEEALGGILEHFTLSSRNIELGAADITNVIACVDPYTQVRRILYDEDFIRDLTEESATVWAARAMLAHELAHHLNGHLQISDSHQRGIDELEADRFAGRVLFNFGASEDATSRVFEQLREGDPYPPRKARVAAAKNGWWSAREQTSYTDADEPPPTPGMKEILSDAGQRPPAGATTSTASNLRLYYVHSPNVPHAGGRPPDAGVQFRLEGTLENVRAGSVQTAIYFTFPDGNPLLADPRETNYYSGARQLATGSRAVPFQGGTLELRRIVVDPMPYYVMNLVPTGYQTDYFILVRAAIFLDGMLVAETAPAQLVVRW